MDQLQWTGQSWFCEIQYKAKVKLNTATSNHKLSLYLFSDFTYTSRFLACHAVRFPHCSSASIISRGSRIHFLFCFPYTPSSPASFCPAHTQIYASIAFVRTKQRKQSKLFPLWIPRRMKISNLPPVSVLTDLALLSVKLWTKYILSAGFSCGCLTSRLGGCGRRSFVLDYDGVYTDIFP